MYLIYYSFEQLLKEVYRFITLVWYYKVLVKPLVRYFTHKRQNSLLISLIITEQKL